MSHPYIDAHVHFWDPAAQPYAWLAGVPDIAGPHLPADLLREAAVHPPAQVVFVECGAPAGAEVAWVEQLARREPRIAAIVAQCDLHRGAATESALAALRSRPLVRGVRHNTQDEPDAGFCARPEFIAGARAAGAAGFTVDVCCRHAQLPAVIRLVRACPGTRFVLDHFGKPDIRHHRYDPWRSHVAELASLPNVDCKLSGLITEADPGRWTVADLRPFVDHALATFGPTRLLFGGDWPVVKLAGDYAVWLDTVRALVSHLAPLDRCAIFNGNAQRAYRLEVTQ